MCVSSVQVCGSSIHIVFVSWTPSHTFRNPLIPLVKSLGISAFWVNPEANDLAPLVRFHDPPNHRSRAHGSKQIFFVKKSKIDAVMRTKGTSPWFYAYTLQNPSGSFSKSPSNFAVEELIWDYRLSTYWEGPQPFKSLIGGSWVQTNIFC